MTHVQKSLRIPVEVWSAVEAIAKAEERTPSFVAIRLIRNGVSGAADRRSMIAELEEAEVASYRAVTKKAPPPPAPTGSWSPQLGPRPVKPGSLLKKR